MPLISTQCPVSTRMPRAWASSPISATSRDLPTPASPATSANLPRPTSASSTSRRKLARSASRSTNSGERRSAQHWAVAPAEVSFQDTSYSRHSSGNPRSQNSPESRNE